VAEAAWIVVGAAGAVSVVAWSMAARRIGLRTALVAAHLVQAAAILAPVVSASATAALLGAVGFGGTFMGITALTLALGRELSPGNTGPAFSLLTASFALGQMLAPFPAGLMLERTGGFHLPLSAAAALVVFGALLVALSPSRAGRAAPAA
jgi:predicted MFS family arabinose efflux permease